MQLFLPNLFIPGAAKSGTSTLHELLNAHPDICMSSVKEPAFWTSTNFKKKEQVLYSNLFINKHAVITGESSTEYMFFPDFIENIKKHYQSLPRFIFILRNPIDRCYSHYWWIKGMGLEKRSFNQAVKNDLERSLKPYNYYPDYYYHFGLYGKWLSFFINNFEKEKIKIITLESLQTNRLKTLNECFSFLGLKELDEIPDIKSNKTKKIKYPKLYHFNIDVLQGKLKLNNRIKKILPDFIIKNIKKTFDYIPIIKNKSNFSYPKLESDDRNWLKSIYYEDVKLLKKITSNEFNEWKDFIN